MVDDESKPERRPTKHMQPPAKWDNPFNPAYSYWLIMCTPTSTFSTRYAIVDLTSFVSPAG